MPFDQSNLTVATDETSSPDAGQTDQSSDPRLWPVFAGLFLLLAGWAASVVIWGVPGLYIPAVFAAPVLVLLVMRIAQG